VEAPGIESGATYGAIVVERRGDDADRATEGDERRREVSASPAAVEHALASALVAAAAASRFDVVAQLAKELEARRLACAGSNVTPIASARRRRR
jgi:hypothetical protein